MTTADVLGAMRRCWQVVVAGLFVTGVVVGVVASHPGIYTTRAEVVMVPPRADAATGGTLISASESLISVAGLVERMANAGSEDPATTNQDVDLAGTGVRSGVSIRLPNSGGQWDYNFTSALLVVQAVGQDSAKVARARDAAVQRVVMELRKAQSDQGVPQDNRITTQVVPGTPQVTYREGHPLRAAAAVGIVGVVLTCLLVVALDQVLGRRRARGQVAARGRAARALGREVPWRRQLS